MCLRHFRCTPRQSPYLQSAGHRPGFGGEKRMYAVRPCRCRRNTPWRAPAIPCSRLCLAVRRVVSCRGRTEDRPPKHKKYVPWQSVCPLALQ